MFHPVFLVSKSEVTDPAFFEMAIMALRILLWMGPCLLIFLWFSNSTNIPLIIGGKNIFLKK